MAPLEFSGYKSIYIGKGTSPGDPRGAHEVGGRTLPPLGMTSTLVAASLLLQLHLQVSWFASGPRKIIMKVLFRFVFLYCETLKQPKNRNWHWALG